MCKQCCCQSKEDPLSRWKYVANAIWSKSWISRKCWICWAISRHFRKCPGAHQGSGEARAETIVAAVLQTELPWPFSCSLGTGQTALPSPFLEFCYSHWCELLIAKCGDWLNHSPCSLPLPTEQSRYVPFMQPFSDALRAFDLFPSCLCTKTLVTYFRAGICV